MKLVKEKYKADMAEIDRKAKVMEQHSTTHQIAQTNVDDLATKINKLGIKLTIHLTLPIVFFIIGIFTLPIGIIFWIIAIVLLAGLFGGKK